MARLNQIIAVEKGVKARSHPTGGMLRKTEDGWALTVRGHRIYEVYTPDWSELAERAIVFPFGPVHLMFEWRPRDGWSNHDPFNGRIELSFRRRHRWSYEVWVGARKTRLYSDADMEAGVPWS